MTIKFVLKSIGILWMLGSPLVFAQNVDAVLNHYKNNLTQNEQLDPNATQEGKTLYLRDVINKKGEKISCHTCHGLDPKTQGKSKAGKIIEPLAPSANAQRFTDIKKVEKWFRRNCRDVFDRECTAKEKVNFISYITSVK